VKSSASARESKERNASEMNGSASTDAGGAISLPRTTTNASSKEKSSTKAAGAVDLHRVEEEAGRLHAMIYDDTAVIMA